VSRIPKSFIDDLISRADIVEIIDTRVSLKKKAKEFVACCPFHNEKTPSFTVSPDKQFYHCFGCGKHGTALGFLMDYENLSYVEAIESLAQSLGLEVPSEQKDFGEKKQPAKEDLFAILQAANNFFKKQLYSHPQKDLVVTYLKNRGLSGKIAKKFQLGFAPDSWDSLAKALAADAKILLKLGLLRKSDSGRVYDYFRSRVQFPIHDYMGRIIGFGGRIIGDGEPKYLNSPESVLFHKGQELYGLYQARPALKKHDAAIIVEGYMDVAALHQHGVEHTVAALGTAVSKDHLTRLYRIVKNIIFCFDGDQAGKGAAIKAMRNILPLIREGRSASFMFLPQGEDPDSYIRTHGEDKFLNAAADSTSLEDFIFELAAEKSLPDSANGRELFMQYVKPLIQQLAPGIYRESLIQRLAPIVNLPDDRVRSFIFPIKGSKMTVRSKGANLAHRAIAFLLEEPKLAFAFEDFGVLQNSKVPEIKLLLDMLDTILKDNLQPAQLYERYVKDERFANDKNKIINEQNMLTGVDLQKGFLEAMANLKRQIAKNQLAQRVSTANSGAEINELINKKTKVTN